MPADRRPSSPAPAEVTMSLPRLLRRVLVQDRNFSITAILLLGVGIGSNTAVFSILNDVFLRPLSGVEDPEGLVALLKLHANGEASGFSFQDFEEYRVQARSFSNLVAARGEDVWWREGGAQRRLDGLFVTGGYFSLLGVRMGLGRKFSPEETVTPDTHPVTILSHELWRSGFDSDPSVIGRQMRLNGVWFTIVGVAPPSFRGVQVDEAPNLWIPLMMEGVARPQFPGLNNGIWRVFGVFGRLKPNTSPEAAQAELTTLSSRIEGPVGTGRQRPRVLLRPDVRRPDPGFTSSALVFLAPFFGVALVLVIVCANLAGLLLARNLLRRREFAVRMALGAPRRALMGQLIGECVFLAGVGSALGFILSRWISAWIQAHAISDLDLSPDYRVGAFTALVALLAGVGIGLIPALQATGRDLVTDLKDQATAPHRARTHGILVSAQIALSLVLLTGAGLFARSLWATNRQEVGFETDHLLLVACDLREGGYPAVAAGEFLETLTGRLRGLPGVRAVARSNEAPMDRGGFSDGATLILEDGSAADTQRVARTRITPGYFDALGLDLMAGRDFTIHDDSTSVLVAIVNETMARRVWPNTDPLGQRFRFAFILWRSDPVTVVGVSPAVRTFSREDQPRAEIFVPLAQHFEPSQWLLIRVGEGAGDLAPVIRDELRRLDSYLPPPRVESVAQRRARLYSLDRFLADMTGAFGILGVTLSALGLMGILSLDVSRRMKEMGIRMALGAGRGQLITIVLGRGLLFALPGIGVGLLAALALSRLMSGFLYGVPAWDPVLFAAAGVLLAVTLGASFAPAVRAISADPSGPLRSE